MNMTIRRPIGAACVTALAVIMTAASARASILINYTTNAPGTKFVSSGTLVLNSSSGDAATITFTPNTTSGSGVPSFIDLGDFQFACASCTPTSSATFGAFTFDLVITDTSDGGATGQFVGSSAGGTLFSNSSTVAINWLPLVLGPGTTNALTGNFGTTYFTTTTVTNLAALNSGSPAGDTTVQGGVNSTAIPEPATLSLIGGGLLGLGIWRKRRSRK